jgi:ferredoxin
VRNGRAGRLDQLAHLMSVLRAMSVATGFMAAHMGHGSTLHQSMPGPVMRIASRYEHLIMRSINFLAMRDFIYNNRSLKAMVDRVSGWVMSTVNGEVLSVDEAKEMAGAIAGAGFTVAAGTCPCRRARNELSDTVPNNTDMVFGEWADNYLKNYPGLYRKLDAEEAQALIEEFDRCGFIHQVYGYHRREGAAYVMCNCDPSICIPLLAQKTRGFDAFQKGRSRALCDAASCVGVEECGVCITRCPFDARSARDGKARVDEEACFGCGVCVVTCRGEASTLSRKKGAELVYAHPFVK